MFFHYQFFTKEHYDVILTISNKTFYLEGYLDSGNHLKSPFSHKAVILVNLEIPVSNLIYVPYHALNSSGVIPCVRPEKVLVNQKEIHNCLIGFSKSHFQLEGCNCILPNQIKEEL